MRALVTGATGKAGRATVRALLERGVEVRALVRDPTAAQLPGEVELVRGDLSDPAGAFTGVEVVHLLSGFADADTAKIAQHAGVRRVSLLWAGYRGPVEEAFAATDLEWTALQPASFLGNTLVWADALRDHGDVAEPFVDVAETMVHEGDVGAVSAAVLVECGHVRRTYELTGGAPVTVRDRVEALADALGRELRLTELSEAEARRRWLAEGYDAALVDTLVAWQQRPVAEATRVSPDVERVLGRPPLSMADWIPEHLPAFR
jgi:uncharacterized protein YbjT (DUF2867 family)